MKREITCLVCATTRWVKDQNPIPEESAVLSLAFAHRFRKLNPDDSNVIPETLCAEHSESFFIGYNHLLSQEEKN